MACSGRRIVDPGFFDPDQSQRSGFLHLHCTWTEPYCGGAEPDPEQLPRPTPWRTTFFVRATIPDSSGRTAFNDPDAPLADSVVTGADGQGTTTLPTGDYLLIDRDRVDRVRHDRILRDHAKPSGANDAADPDCLRRWLLGPFQVIRITPDDTLSVRIDERGNCPWYSTPCVSYHGPLPP